MLELKKQGYQILAVAPLDDYSSRFAEYEIEFQALEMDNQGTNPLKDSLLIIRLVRLFMNQKPSCILSYTPKCNIYAGIAARLLNYPIINNISGLGTAFIRENLITHLVKFLYSIALKNAVRVFFQNKEDLALFVEKGLVKKQLTDLLPGSGVDLEKFSPKYKEKTSTQFTFLFVARILKDKGILELVEAMRLLKSQYPEINCQILGFLDVKNATAITREQLQTWIDEGIVEYLGQTDNVLEFLHQADCVVLPSYREGTPRSLLEAASVSKPIITTDTVGCREVVNDGENGFLCEVKNSLDLKEKMEKMFLLPIEQRLIMGQKGREKMCREFNERIVIDKYLQQIQSMTA